MLGLATVTYSPVSMVTRHGSSLTLICVTRLGSAHSIMTVSALWWGLDVYAGVPPFPTAPARFQTVGHHFCPLLYCFSVAIRTTLPVPVCLSEVFHLVSRSGRFLPSSRGGNYPGRCLALHRFNTLDVGGLLVWLGLGGGPPRMSLPSLAGAWRASQPLYPLPPARVLD